MKCQNCSLDIELSWARYFKSPLGRFRCHRCNTKFKLARTWTYYLWLIAWIGALFSGEIYLLWRFDPEVAPAGVFVLIMLAIYFPIDRAIELKLGAKKR